MDNIADKIIEQNSKPTPDEETDSLGIPLWSARKNPVDHLCAHILANHPNLYIDPLDDRIYEKRMAIDETEKNVTKLANYYDQSYRLPKIYPLVYNRLRHFLPRLNRDLLWISPNLLFDRRTGEIIEQDIPKENHI